VYDITMWLKARWLVVGLLCVPFCSSAKAEWKGSANFDATAEGLYWTSGTVGPDSRNIRGIGTVKIPASLRYNRSLRLRVQPLVQWDPDNPSKNERYYQDLQEGYLQLQSLPWTLQAGYNTQTWGDTDVFNPLDVVNARRFFDPFRSEKMGAATLLAKYEWEKVFLEALWIPEQRKTLVPGSNSRWLPRDVYKSRSFQESTTVGELILPNDLTYDYQAAIEQDRALSHNFGARAKFRFPGFDCTIAGFEGASTAPAVNIRFVSYTIDPIKPGDTTIRAHVDPGTGLTLRAIYYKTRMVGTSFVWVAGGFLIKGAAAYTKVISRLPASLLPRDSQENVLGLERTFSVGSGTLTALAQGTYIQHKERMDSNSISLSRMFDKAAMAGIRWAPTEKFTVQASFLYDLLYTGHFEHLDLGYKIADGWNAKLAGDLLGGKTGTPLGTYDRNDRLTISLNVTK